MVTGFPTTGHSLTKFAPVDGLSPQSLATGREFQRRSMTVSDDIAGIMRIHGTEPL
jgi:hypothetical protein